MTTTLKLLNQSYSDQSSFPEITRELKYTYLSEEEWKLDGLCRSIDPDLWFPDGSGSGERAKKICKSCPVIDKCLQYAMNNGEKFGVWGGMSTNERRKFRRKWRTLQLGKAI